jgi:hypothetical protein
MAASGDPDSAGRKMPAIPARIIELIQSRSRLPGTDAEIEAAFWSAYPRFRFFKCLPWQARLLDISAGSGGLAVWREWLPPMRIVSNGRRPKRRCFHPHPSSPTSLITEFRR